MSLQTYQTDGFAYQGAGLFAYQEEPGIAPAVDEVGGGGNWNLLKKRKKQVRIKYSDFESREAYAKALAQAATPIVQAVNTAPQITPVAPQIFGVEEDEDDLIITALMLRMLHVDD